MINKRNKLIRGLLCKLIGIYQFLLSPIFGRQCRFHPTCSVYTRESIMKHGALKGIALGSARICRCHPYYKGQYQDPVPESFVWRDIIRYKRDAAKKRSKKTAKTNNKNKAINE